MPVSTHTDPTTTSPQAGLEFDGCAAATSTLYFAPDGAVRACCVNHDYVFGRIPEHSIREVWEGARIGRLRDALDNDDYSLGCQECGSRFDAGGREWSNAPQFDQWAGVPVGEYPKRMDFILSITCNLQCAMCTGEWSSAIRTQREGRPPLRSPYGDAFFEELVEYLPHLELASFLGGEPFLAREQRRVLDLMVETGFDAPINIVTNGTQWNERVEHYLRNLDISIAVSVDGATAATNEALRIGTDHERMVRNVDRMQELVEARGGGFGHHYCLMVQNWHELGRFLLEADRKDRFVSIMTVTTDGFSLFELPSVELRPIVAALDEEDGRIGDSLGRNRPVWDAELARLKGHLSRLEHNEDPVWVPMPQAERDRVRQAETQARRDEFAAARRDLASWADRPPVVLEASDGVIRSVETAPWAAGLRTEDWVGLEASELVPHLSHVLGTTRVTATGDDDADDGSVLCTEVRFGDDPRPITFRSVSLHAADDAGTHLTVALGTRDALPELSGSTPG